jgi:hypothetical protein
MSQLFIKFLNFQCLTLCGKPGLRATAKDIAETVT